MQPCVQHGAGARKITALHQRDDEGVLDQRALRMAAADTHDFIEHGRQVRDAAAIVTLGERAHGTEQFRHHGSGRQLAIGEALLDHGKAFFQRRLVAGRRCKQCHVNVGKGNA